MNDKINHYILRAQGIRGVALGVIRVIILVFIAAGASVTRASTATAVSGQTVTLSVAANGTAPFTYQWYKDGVALSWSNSAQYTINAVTPADSGSYTAAVSNSAGTARSDVASLSVSSATVAPSLQSQPASVTVSSGSSASFSVVATGSPAPAFQWMKNGSNISGATSSTFSIANAALSDAGSYSVKVSNSAGSVVSNLATLTVSLFSPAPAPTPVVPAPPVSALTVIDNSFESVVVGNNNFYAFAYAPIVAGWTYVGNTGITGNNSGFTSGNQPAPSGTQVALVQCQGSMATQVNFAAGTYTLSAYVANRMNWGTWQAVKIYIDSALVGTFTGTASYTLATTNPFTVNAGIHTISFVGQSVPDATLFLDLITINPVGTGVRVGSNGFEAPDVGGNYFTAFQYQPQTTSGTQDWVFQGNAGVTGNNSGFTSGNPAAPEGKQVAFVQTTGTMSQQLSFPSSGTYQLSVSAAQRQNWGQGAQTVQVYLDSSYVGSISPSGGTYQTIKLSFSTSAGSHQLSFRGTTTIDTTVFLDQIQIQ